MTADADGARERTRAVWLSGDWEKVATYIAEAGPQLLNDIGEIGPGVQLLDVATGNGGSVAIPAALRGARVTGCDLAEEWLTAARGHAAAAGVNVEWVFGDAVDLPFPDDSFDVVTSTFGHMFAPDQAAAARARPRLSSGRHDWPVLLDARRPYGPVLSEHRRAHAATTGRLPAARSLGL